MATVMLQTENAAIPDWIDDLESFGRWVDSPDFPDTGRFSFINGTVWADTSMEQLLTHNLLKVRITSALDALVVAMALGYLFGDRARLRNDAADLSVEPDAMFVSFEAIRAGRATLVAGAADGFVSVDGTPDLIVEVVSDLSVQKDRVELRNAYFAAGVAEYWLVDARSGKADFEILRRTARGFSARRPGPQGWIASQVFNRSFRLTQTTDPLGNPQFNLEHRQ